MENLKRSKGHSEFNWPLKHKKNHHNRNEKDTIILDPLETLHRKEHKWKCGNCYKIFSTKILLKQHVAAVHDGIKPFKCKICEYKAGLR